MSKVLVVGAGFAGSVIARQLAENGHSILVFDKRNHVAGNAYDRHDDYGILVHKYGPHIFHTNSKEIFDYLSRFTEWIPYEHRVLSKVNNVLYPFPVNRTTLNKVFGIDLKPEEVQPLLDMLRRKDLAERPQNTEELVLGTLGKFLYSMFYENYTRKQWGMEPSKLKTAVAARIPVRTNDDDRYFTDDYQAMPKNGYTEMFLRMLNHSNIKVCLNTSYDSIAGQMDDVEHTFFTGPIDEFFSFCYGKLPYRSLHFAHQYRRVDSFQEAATVNYPGTDANYTRITEFKKLTGQKAVGTSIVYEYPADSGEPYYPIPTEENEALFRKYRELAKQTKNVTFVGRLAQYKYYNMDQVVGAAIAASLEYMRTKA